VVARVDRMKKDATLVVAVVKVEMKGGVAIVVVAAVVGHTVEMKKAVPFAVVVVELECLVEM
jgi:hypothetical protein